MSEVTFLILKEFDLDLPFVGVDKEEYEAKWKQKRILFRDQVRCIASMFERYFSEYKFKTHKSWKLLVNCYSDSTNAENMRVPGEVYEVSINIDIEDFFSSSSYKRKILILEMLREGIHIILREEKWNPGPFEQVFKKIVDEDYRNTYVLRSGTLSPNKSFSAELLCEHEVEYFDISIVIKNDSGYEIKKQRVIRERPNEWAVHKYIGELLWLSNKEIVLLSKSGNEQCRVTYE